MRGGRTICKPYPDRCIIFLRSSIGIKVNCVHSQGPCHIPSSKTTPKFVHNQQIVHRKKRRGGRGEAAFNQKRSGVKLWLAKQGYLFRRLWIIS